MAFRFILLILPALALASINIEISGNYTTDKMNVTVRFVGYDRDIISETERTTFNVSDDSLKNAIRICSGYRPHTVTVRNPTPYGNVSSDSQVNRTLRPKHVKAIWANKTRIAIVHQTFENNSTIPVTFDVGISQSVVNTVWSSWRKSGELSGININYGIKLKVFNVGIEPSFRYTSSWGQHILQLQTVTVGASSNIDMTLQPGEAVVARIEATILFFKVEVKYVASLSGTTYGGYFAGKSLSFHATPINSCMERAGIRKQKTSRELIFIELFADSRVIVSDLHRGHILMVV